MLEIQLIPAAIIFCLGAIVGIAGAMLFNKMRSGTVSAGKIKKEMEDYQDQVEAHFEETSQKFKDMAAQYQDLYKHLSVGATTLCRPETSIAGLSDLRDPLSMAPKIEPPIKKVVDEQVGTKQATTESIKEDSSQGKLEKVKKEQASADAEVKKQKPV